MDAHPSVGSAVIGIHIEDFDTIRLRTQSTPMRDLADGDPRVLD
jgi:hypothetical protein